MTNAHTTLFRTLADPTRRAIFEGLCREGEQTVGALTARAKISQPAVSKHLGVLKQAADRLDEADGRVLGEAVRSARRSSEKDGPMNTRETRSVVVEREIAHPPEKLWRALTQPHLIAEWLMQNDFSPVVGHHFKLRGEWGGVLDCEVLEVEPNKTLAYTWNHAHDDPAFALQSVVTFTLTPAGSGTHLRMEQKGFRPDQPQAFGGARLGWQKFFANLEDLLARTN
jgi:uncharacterized protein YndB with AHSA1/START domain